MLYSAYTITKRKWILMSPFNMNFANLHAILEWIRTFWFKCIFFPFNQLIKKILMWFVKNNWNDLKSRYSRNRKQNQTLQCGKGSLLSSWMAVFKKRSLVFLLCQVMTWKHQYTDMMILQHWNKKVDIHCYFLHMK